jgi:hypothetical protein
MLVQARRGSEKPNFTRIVGQSSRGHSEMNMASKQAISTGRTTKQPWKTSDAGLPPHMNYCRISRVRDGSGYGKKVWEVRDEGGICWRMPGWQARL